MSLAGFASRFLDRHELGWVRDTFFWKAAQSVYFCFGCLSSVPWLFRKGASGRDTVLIMIHSLHGGGAERVASILASELTRYYRVIVMYGERSDEPYPLSPAVGTVLIPYRLWDPERGGRFVPFLVRTLKKRQNVCASVSLLFPMNALNVASRANDKVICSERNNPAKSADAGRFETVKAVYGAADHVVFQSTVVRDLFDERIKTHSTILPNPVNVSCMRRPGGHRIVNSARLVPQKNQAMLIRAFGRFAEKHPDYTLSIYGKGPLKDSLAALIGELGLSGKVKLEGHSDRVQEAMADAETFVLSSDFEGLPNALLEAMMMGFPCISTDCEGASDVIASGQNGLLTACGNEQEMLEALLLLAEDEALREELGRQARITAQRFKSEEVAKEWAELIERIRTGIS